MNARSVKKIERDLRAELESLRALIDSRQDAGATERMTGDLFDAAQTVEHQEHQRLSLGRMADRARRLAAALERVRTGRYGTCRECGTDIAPARLKAIPDADLCVKCQERVEEAARTEALAGAEG